MTDIEQVCTGCKRTLAFSEYDSSCQNCQSDMRPITDAEDEWIGVRSDGHVWIPGSLL